MTTNVTMSTTEPSQNPREIPFFVHLESIEGVNYNTHVVIDARAPRKNVWDELNAKYYAIKDPTRFDRDLPDLEDPDEDNTNIYGESLNLEGPAGISSTSYYMAFPRLKMFEFSLRAKNITEDREKRGKSLGPIKMINMTPEALDLLAEFMQIHLSNKIKEIEKPMKKKVTEYLSPEDRRWVAKWMDLDKGPESHYDNWLLFRMVDMAEALEFDDLTTIVAGVLGECIKGKPVLDLRRFFHEHHPNGGFTEEEEYTLMSQCRQTWPENANLFNTAHEMPPSMRANTGPALVGKKPETKAVASASSMKPSTVSSTKTDSPPTAPSTAKPKN
jgi:hypothetical protein